MTLKYDENMLRQRTCRAAEYSLLALAHAVAFRKDRTGRSRVNTDKRIARRECLYCFHFCGGMLAGQAFTNYVCWDCGVEYSHHNTGVPMLCNVCADKHNACVRCGAERNLELPPDIEKILAKSYERYGVRIAPSKARSARGKQRRK